MCVMGRGVGMLPPRTNKAADINCFQTVVPQTARVRNSNDRGCPCHWTFDLKAARSCDSYARTKPTENTRNASDAHIAAFPSAAPTPTRSSQVQRREARAVRPPFLLTVASGPTDTAAGRDVARIIREDRARIMRE